MVALPTPDVGPDTGGSTSERIRLLQELGSQPVRSWAALDSGAGAKAKLVVVERAEKRAFEEDEIEAWVRDARQLQSLQHSNLARVRDVLVTPAEVLVVSDFVDGVRWAELAAAVPVEVALRVVIDALAGLGALHGLRDAQRAPLGLVHGALTPDCLLVGLDGVTRVVGASRPRSATARLSGASSAHLAPEVLLEDESADARADVYSVGVLLWEALSKRPFLPDLQPSAIVTHLLSGRVPAVTAPAEAPWAAPLAEVIMRALSADPGKRFPTAAAMATEIRRIGAARLPAAVRVTAVVKSAFGDAIRTRRERLERGEARASAVSLRGAAEDVPIEVEPLEPEPSQTASTVPPAGPVGEAPAVPAMPAPPPVGLPSPLPVAAPPLSPPVAVSAPPLVGPPPPPVAAPPPAPIAVSSLGPPPQLSPIRAPAAAAAPPAPALALVAPPPAPVIARPVPSSSGPELLTATTGAPLALPPLPALDAVPSHTTSISGRRRQRTGLAIAGAIALAAIVWWLAARGPATPTAANAPPALLPGAAAPAAAPGAEAARPEARAGEAAAVAAPGRDAPATAPPAPVPAPPVPAPSVPAPPLPARPAAAPPIMTPPARGPNPRPGRRGYDPQGI